MLNCDMSHTEIELEQVEQLVREDEWHIAIQRNIVQRLTELGEPTTVAEKALHKFEETLELHREHLEQLRGHTETTR